MDKTLPFVISDLDGTLVSEGYNIKPETIIDVLKYQKASGHKFSFATGRSDFMCYPIIDELEIESPVISCNGALIRDIKTNKVLHAEYIDNEIAIDCFKKADDFGLDITGYDEDGIICTTSADQYRALSELNKKIGKKEWFIPFKIYPDIKTIVKDLESGKLHLLKIMIDCNVVHKEKEAVSVFENYEKELNFTWSGNNFLDAMKKGVSKGTALVHLAKILNVDVKDIVAFGDNYNDIEMIDEVNKGYAIGNAVQPLKDVAYKVADTLENNGVGKILVEMVNDTNEKN